MTDDISNSLFISGNEAIALAAIHARTGVATGYPGTPSTDIIEAIARIGAQAEAGTKVFWHGNEKTALEMALGCALCAHSRSLVAMKHVGLNVAADAFKSAAVTGITGALVLVACDDRGMHSSQNEFDSRHYADEAGIPVLEPADAQQAYDMARAAFPLSAETGSLVMIRMTTRVSHSRGLVRTTPADDGLPEVEMHQHRPEQYVVAPTFSIPNVHRLYDAAIPARRAPNEQSPFNRQTGSGPAPWGLLSSGIATALLDDLLDPADSLGNSVPRLNLGACLPLPLETIRAFRSSVKRMMVLEDGYALLNAIRAAGIDCEPAPGIQAYGELTPDGLSRALAQSGIIEPDNNARAEPTPSTLPRPPTLCPGCPHRPMSFALKQLDQPLIGDIGCSTLTAIQPFDLMSTALEMGASIPMAEGVYHLHPDSKPTCMIGDGTFLHSGITGLIAAVENKASIRVLIMDNATIGMTGQQEIATSPGHSVDLEALVRSVGVADVRIVHAHDQQACTSALATTGRSEGISVIIVRDACMLVHPRRDQDGNLGAKHRVDADACTLCGNCLDIGCPSISLSAETGKPVIDDSCVGCGDCAQVCTPCPAGTPVTAFHAAHLNRNDRHGAALIHASNPFASLCGEICSGHCERPAIHSLEESRFPHKSPDYRGIEAQLCNTGCTEPPGAPTRQQKILVIGAGPAGLTAARELVREGFEVSLWEATEQAGGLPNQHPDYPAINRQRWQSDLERVLGMPGISIQYGQAVDSQQTLNELARQHVGIILATGAESGLSAEADNVFTAGDLSQPREADIAHAVGSAKTAVASLMGFLVDAPKEQAVIEPLTDARPSEEKQAASDDHFDIFLGSLGGQGAVSTSNILAEAFIQQGWDCKSTNVLGMAQRGGVVSVQLRLDRTRVSSPMIMTGKAMLGGFTEPLEALRWQHMLAVGASVVIQDKRVVPPSAGQAYPQDPIADLRNLRPDLHIQVSPVAVSPAPLESAYLLGMLSNHLPLNETQWHGGLQRTVAEKYWLNTWHAFQKGRDFLHEGCRITQRA